MSLSLCKCGRDSVRNDRLHSLRLHRAGCGSRRCAVSAGGDLTCRPSTAPAVSPVEIDRPVTGQRIITGSISGSLYIGASSYFAVADRFCAGFCRQARACKRHVRLRV
jgi:hypothetical protein